MNRNSLSRRNFLKASGMAGLGLALAACAPAAPGAAPAAEGDAPSTEGPVPILFWFQAQNHQDEYDARIDEVNETFGVDFSYEILDRDAMNKKFQATLMAGEGFPDIIEQNADDVVKYLKGTDEQIPLVAMNDFLDESGYYDKVLKSRWDRFSKDGKIYAGPHDVHPLVMLYHSAAWEEQGVDMEQIATWDDLLTAIESVDLTMPDGRDRYAIMDGLSATNLPARMLEKGIWWTDEAGEPMLTNPDFKVCVDDWMRFQPYVIDIDWSNQVAMVKEGQVMMQLCPDWLYGIHKQGTANDAEFVANSPMRITRIPDFVPEGPHSGTWGGTGVSIPKATDIVDLGMDIALHLYFNNEGGQLEDRYVDSGILPPVPESWEGEAFHEAEDYLGGQVGGEVFIASAEDLPGYYENWKTSMVSAAWGEQFPLAWAGELSVDEAIAVADENARAEIEKNA